MTDTTLNEQQQEAIRCADGPSVILAGAGSGKTRVLIHKVAHLIEEKQVNPHNIVLITFTNKAAGEMKTRIGKLSKTKEKLQLGFVGTFHSLCARILRKQGYIIGIDHDFTIYTGDEQEDLVKQILKKGDYGKVTAGYFLNKISEAKNQLITPDKYLDVYAHYRAAQIAEVYLEYEQRLTANHALDFDDLIMKAVQLLRQEATVLALYHREYTYIMVDEFQDTNVAQYALTKLLTGEKHNITVVGDFSQAIYSWRGADIRNLERFSQDYPEGKIFYLERNYRSTQDILNYAYDKITQNKTHPVLKLFTENDTGQEVSESETENEQHEALYVVKEIIRAKTDEGEQYGDEFYDEIAVLYRTNAQSRAIEEAFLHYGIPYMLVGGTRFYDRKEVKDVLSYMRLILNPTDTVATERVEKLGKRRWTKFRELYDEYAPQVHTVPSDTLLELVVSRTGYLELFDKNNPEDYARLENIKELKSVAERFPDIIEFFEQVALVESEYFAGEKKAKGTGHGVRLMSLHASKGLEFNTVFIVGLEEGLLPHSRSLDDTYALEEERRLFYVGITRARQKLYITWTRKRGMFGRTQITMKSRFIAKEGDAKDEFGYSDNTGDDIFF